MGNICHCNFQCISILKFCQEALACYNLSCRVRIEKVLLESNVLGEAQRSMVDGGMRVEDLPTDHGSQSGAVSPHLGQPGHTRESSDRFSEAFIGVGGPAGLWHFMYRSIYLDQYVSSEFSSPVNNRQQQKRYYCKINAVITNNTFVFFSFLNCEMRYSIAGCIELTRSFMHPCMIKELDLTKLSSEGMKIMVCSWVLFICKAL